LARLAGGDAQPIEFAPVVFKHFARERPAPFEKPCAQRLRLGRGLLAPADFDQDTAPCVGREQPVRRASRAECRVGGALARKTSISLQGSFRPAGLALDASGSQQSFQPQGRIVDERLKRRDGAVVLLQTKFQPVGGIERARRRGGRERCIGNQKAKASAGKR
jgi:hypothetical protein